MKISKIAELKDEVSSFFSSCIFYFAGDEIPGKQNGSKSVDHSFISNDWFKPKPLTYSQWFKRSELNITVILSSLFKRKYPHQREAEARSLLPRKWLSQTTKLLERPRKSFGVT